jgi:hypothetical protein
MVSMLVMRAWRWPRMQAKLATEVLAAAGAVVGPAMWVAGVPEGGQEIPDAEDLIRGEAPYVVSTERVEHLAAMLAEEPLYVDPLVPLPREGLDGIGDVLAEASVPVHAAVVSVEGDDESGGDHEVLAAALAAVAEEEGVYLVVGPHITSAEMKVAAAPSGMQVDPFMLDSAMWPIEADRPAQMLQEAVAALEELEFTPGEGYVPGFVDHAEPNLPGPRAERYWFEGALPGFAVAGPLVAGAVLLVVWGLSQARTLLRSGGAGRALDDDRLRRMAEAETTRLRALLNREESGLGEDYLPQADAALIVMDSGPRGLDLLGVVVLARRLLAAAKDPADLGLGPCSVNPLHPWAQDKRWSRSAGGTATLCPDCAALDDAERTRRRLRLRTGGRVQDYATWSDSPWIRHRFGARNPRHLVEKLLEAHHVR